MIIVVRVGKIILIVSRIWSGQMLIIGSGICISFNQRTPVGE